MHRIFPVAFPLLWLLMFSSSGCARAQGGEQATPPPSAVDVAGITAVVEGFHRALDRGDGAAAMALLAPDALVIESGTVQTREEYAHEHLDEDIAFAKSAPSTRSALKILQEGMVAWISSTTEIRGSYKGRQINSAGAELMVVTQTSAGWRIRAIHWSDHPVRARK